MKTTLTRCNYILKAGFLGLLILLISTGFLKASHMVGGEISYQWVSGNVYNVKLTLYRDCAGITVANYQTLQHESVSCGMTGSFTVYQVGAPEQVSPICAASVVNSSCNGGVLYGVEKYTFEGLDTLPGNCSDWEFTYNQCCRNASITNLQNAASVGSYYSSMLNNLDVPFNNSVTFGSIPYSIINNNATTQLSWNTYDSDGDSLVYELVPARDYNGSQPYVLNYNSGYTYLEPFLSSLPTVLNFANGLLQVSPNAQQVSVVCMKVSEYRNGIFIGEVNRDYQIVVINSTNNPPTLTGMNGSSNYIISGCPGDSITFNVTGTDPNIPQYVNLTMSNPGTAAVFTSNSGIVAQGTFTWIPVNADISASAYTFIITANDDNCDYYGTFSQAYYVYVNGCNTNDVWPGDANSDGDDNLYDLLAVGIAYNDNGPARTNATLNWNAETCSDWTNSFISGINHKHADTNGDGTVTMNDTAAIYQNYGMYHPLRNSNPNTTTVADLVVTSNADTTDLSMPVDFDIAIATPVDSIYGLAFRLYFDPSLVDVNSINVTYPGCIFGINAVDMITVDKSQGMNGFVDIALSRIDHLNISGAGPVARVTIVTTDNVSGKVTLSVSPFDIEAITSNESLVSLNGIGDGVVIDPNYLGVAESVLDNFIQVYPTPAHDVLHVNYTGSQKVDYIKMFDVAGREVIQILNPGATTSIDLKNISQGTYFVRIGSGENTVHKKIVVF